MLAYCLLSVFAAVGASAAPSQLANRQGNSWFFFGCFNELSDGLHVLNHRLSLPFNTPYSAAACLNICFEAGFHIGALMNGNECWCDNAMSSKAVQLNQDDCNVPCQGNPTEICGGVYHLQMYYTQPGGATNINPVTPTVIGSRPEVFLLDGCFLDSRSARALRGAFYELSDNTPEGCAHTCYLANFKFAGVEYGRECYCGQEIFQPKAQDSDCYQACIGDSTLACGAPNRIAIYEARTPPSVPGPVEIVGTGDAEYQHQGCFIDTVSPRTFTGYSFTDNGMTAALCAAACYSRQLGYAGVEYSRECYCSSTAPTTAQVDESACNMVCGGDTAHTCGGGARMDVYKSSTLF